MLDPQLLQIGPLMLPLTWLVLAVLGFASVYVAERLSPMRWHIKGVVSGELPTAIILYLLVYKFAPVLWHLPDVFSDPIAVLLTPGTPLSMMMAIILSFAWLTWAVVRSPYALSVADVIAFTDLLTVFSYNVIFKDLGQTTFGWWGWRGEEYRYHPLHIYRLVLLAPLLVWGLLKWRKLASGYLFSWIAMWSGVVYTVVSFVDYHTGATFIGLTVVQWISIVVALAGWGTIILIDHKKRAGDESV